MTLPSPERSRIRRLMLWFALIGVSLGLLAYFFGDDVATFIATLANPKPPEPAKLTVETFWDANANGELDLLEPAEHGVPGAIITLSGPQTVESLTNSVGAVIFLELPPGNYTIAAALDGIALAVTPATVSLASGQQSRVLLALGAADDTTFSVAAIRGGLYEDTNVNGVRDEGEPGLEGVAVTLRQELIVLAENVTGTDGTFEFADLLPGQYEVRLQPSVQDQKTHAFPGDLQEGVTIRSEADVQYINFLAEPVVTPGASRTVRLASARAVKLAAATPGVDGFEIIKLGSDADESDVEFVHVKPGGKVSFEIEIEVVGGGSTTFPDTKIVDDYQDFLAISGITGGGVDDGDKIIWNLGPLTVGDAAKVSYNGTIATTAQEGLFDNEATVSATGATAMNDDTTLVITKEGEPGVLPNTTIRPTGNRNQLPREGERVAEVGVPAWAVAGLASLPVVVIGTVLLLGWRRARS